MPANIPCDIVAAHKAQRMTALQVQQAELPPRAAPSRKLTREVSSAISESAAKRAEALAALEAQVADTKLSLEVGAILPAAAVAQQGRQSCLQTALLHGGCWTLALPVQTVLHKGCWRPELAVDVEHPASPGLSASISERCCL